MKYIRKFLVLLVLLMPIMVNAEELDIEPINNFTTNFEDELKLEEDVNGSSISAGTNVTSLNLVNGINALFGENITYEGDSEYLVALGATINLKGNIQNDGFILGDSIEFNKNFNIERDLFVFGNVIRLSGNINRNITIYASEVILDNVQILGNIDIYSTNITVNDNTFVNGTFAYNEDALITISQNAEITNINKLDSLNQTNNIADMISTFIIDFAGMMVIFLVLAFLVPNLFKTLEKKNEDITLSKIFKLLGFGALVLIGIPMICVMLLTTVIGTTFAIILLLIYIIIVWISIIFTGYLLGYIIWNKLIKKENNILLIGLIGITLIYILQYVPLIGPVVTILSLMIGLGIVLQMFKK